MDTLSALLLLAAGMRGPAAYQSRAHCSAMPQPCRCSLCQLNTVHHAYHGYRRGGSIGSSAHGNIQSLTSRCILTTSGDCTQPKHPSRCPTVLYDGYSNPLCSACQFARYHFKAMQGENNQTKNSTQETLNATQTTLAHQGATKGTFTPSEPKNRRMSFEI